jgi:hypothetical protein
MKASFKTHIMPIKKPFRYKVGKTEIECDENNKHGVRLAYINTIMYWLIRLIIALSSGATLHFLFTLFYH